MITQVKMVAVVIPYLPPSGNHYVAHTRKGRHYVTPAARKFWDDVAMLTRGEFVIADQYRVTIGIVLGPKRKGDLDNFCKVILDSLVKAGIIHSDAAVTELHMTKCRGESDRTIVKVEAI